MIPYVHVSRDDGNTLVPFHKNVLSVASLPLTLWFITKGFVDMWYPKAVTSSFEVKGLLVAGIAASKKRLIEKGMKSP